jgi:hypothetical protein
MIYMTIIYYIGIIIAMDKISPLKNNKQNAHRGKKKTYVTTGQASGITHLAGPTLYQYTREFYDLFSAGVQQHKRGRKWGAADLDLLLSIKALRHERTPTGEIHAKLAGGWRVKHSPWSGEDRDHLVEAFVAVTDESNRIMREAERAVDNSKWVTKLGIEEHRKIQDLEIRQKELEEAIYKILKHFKLVREMDGKKPWWKRLSDLEE